MVEKQFREDRTVYQKVDDTLMKGANGLVKSWNWTTACEINGIRTICTFDEEFNKLKTFTIVSN